MHLEEPVGMQMLHPSNFNQELHPHQEAIILKSLALSNLKIHLLRIECHHKLYQNKATWLSQNLLHLLLSKQLQTDQAPEAALL